MTSTQPDITHHNELTHFFKNTVKAQRKQSQQCNEACGGRPTPSVGGFHLLQEQESQRTGKSKGKFWKTVFLGGGVLTQAFNKPLAEAKPLAATMLFRGAREKRETDFVLFGNSDWLDDITSKRDT